MKSKNIKKSSKQIRKQARSKSAVRKLQSPRIYRRITESLEFVRILQILKKMTIVFIFTAVVALILFTAANLYRNYSKNQQIQVQRQKLIHEINIWKSFSDKYKNYKEVYFQIAAREFQLGNFKSAKQYLQRTLFIDPNYEEALKLQRELESK